MPLTKTDIFGEKLTFFMTKRHKHVEIWTFEKIKV